MDPMGAMSAVDNDAVAQFAKQVQEKLMSVLKNI